MPTSLGTVVCTFYLLASVSGYLSCNTTLSEPGYTILGPGRCQDKAGNTSTAYTCISNSSCPQDADNCSKACAAASGCTGFEMRTDVPNATSPYPSCCILVSKAPSEGKDPVLPWSLLPGQQPMSGRVVVQASGNATVGCCYKRNYPNPNPPLNPVKVPPVQSELQKEIWANDSRAAAIASEAARPSLESMLAKCMSLTTLFNATHCPAMARVAALNNTNVTPALILAQYDAEMLVAELGHGYGTELTPLGNIFSESYPFLLNLCAYAHVWKFENVKTRMCSRLEM